MGGGFAREDNNEYMVMRYDPSRGEWSQLPKSTERWFAMTSVKDQLLLAGGGGDSTAIQLWDCEGHRWNTQHYPRMPTGRTQSAAVGYQQYLIVACGSNKDTVEVLDCSTHQWYSAQPVPVGGDRMTAVIIVDYMFISSYNWSDDQPHVFSAHLPTLISNATHNTTTGPTWQELLPSPVCGPTLLALQNHLLLVGGREVGGKGRRKELYRYDAEGKKWSKCGEFPVGMYAPSCAVLPSGELLVAGGGVEGVGWYSQ